MRFAHLAALALAVGATLACDDGTDVKLDDTFGDTGDEPTPPPGDPIIQIIDPSGCNGGGTAFEFGIETDNWAGLAILTIWDTSFDPAFDEEHIMEHGNFDPDGAWDQWNVTLSDEATLGNQVPGSSTIFNCDNETFLTYAVEVTSDAAGNNVTDCAVFGHNPAEIIDGSWPDGGEANTNGTVIGTRFANCINFNQ